MPLRRLLWQGLLLCSHLLLRVFVCYRVDELPFWEVFAGLVGLATCGREEVPGSVNAFGELLS